MESSRSPLIQTLCQYLQRVHPQARSQIEAALTDFAASTGRAAFFRLFALAPRWTGRQTISPSAGEREALAALHPNLERTNWHDDQFARLWILAAVQDIWPAEQFARELDTLFNTADTGELVALYRCLALLREPQQFIARAREGARSNMVTVFLAVAHDNCFAAQFFDEEGWNQLVLKAIFNSCALDPIVELEERNNPALSHMLSDYVRERWAASRTVPWDIWRCIGRYADADGNGNGDLDLLATALGSEQRMTQLAAALALRDSGAPAAQALLNSHDEFGKTIKNMNWQSLVALDQGG